MEEEKRRKHDIHALLVGGALILLVGGYAAWKSFRSDDLPASDMPYQKSVMDTEAESVPTIDQEALRQKITNGDAVRIIDIRSADAFESEHIRGALSLSLAALEGFSIGTNEIAVVVFAAEDPDTFEVARNVMSQKSFPYFFLKGGFSAWKGAGNPLVSIGDPRSFSDQAKIVYVTPEDLARVLESSPESIFLIDVQSEADFKRRHIKGAMNIPLIDLEKRILETRLPVARTLVVYGGNDVASFQAGVRVSDSGVLTAKTLSGNDHLSKTSILPIDSDN